MYALFCTGMLYIIQQIIYLQQSNNQHLLTMQPKSFNTTKVPRSNTVIQQASIAGNVIYVSGTTGVDPLTGKLIEGGFEEQIRQAFKNIQTILEEAGSALNKIAKLPFGW